jgi:dinuclear metal center YbgI/SA1388 family protein
VAAQLAEILAYLDALLEPDRFDDYCVNGLQVPGPPEVSTVATGVSAHAQLFELAASERAQLLLVHHGLFWGDGARTIDTLLKRRLKLLFDADIALAAYHLPLDAHLDVGNNALLADALGATVRAPFAQHRGEPIGVLAELPAQGIPFPELRARAAAACGGQPLAFDSGPEPVRTLAIVTGAGADFLDEAAAAGADALVTGEAAERTMALAREHGLHLIAAGHYATERFGVRRLGELLGERFGVGHAFLDVPNPV